MSKIKILWIIPKWTLPATDGARVATNSLIKNTIKAGAVVDVMCLAGGEEKVDPEFMFQQWKMNDLNVIRRKEPVGQFKKYLYYLKKILENPKTPLTFASFSEPSLQELLHKHLEKNLYDYILLDGLHLGATYFSKKKQVASYKVPKIIYRAHNIETDLWTRSYQTTRNPLLKLLFYHQAKQVEKIESSVINFCDGIAPIAGEDLAYIQRIPHKAKSKLVPLGMDFSKPLPQVARGPIKFLFIGRLDWPPNRDGLAWVLKEIWPQVIRNRPEAVLKIVGSGNAEWLKDYSHQAGVEVQGFVANLEDAYRDCHFTIVPVVYGSGTRIKVIESFAMGRKLISTQMGVQGADLQSTDYIQAETTQDWIDTLSDIKLDESLVTQLEESRKKMAQKFCEKEIGQQFYDWLKTIS